ncbi:hypothetical protein SDJN02_13592 [Cucurbita argyrosperma subsp. argyrosperma]|nr:hypothetical protein SDJN02_13592 [Cucurbita argyrosperma subsp. argyrosperma]
MAEEVVTREELLSLLQELQIDFSRYEHPAVLAVEAQDKKNRYYIDSASADTKIFLKGLYTLLVPVIPTNHEVLSARLGLGKGGLRMASEETLDKKLKVRTSIFREILAV